MGLIHSRASKKLAKAETALLDEQTRQLRDRRHAAEAKRAGNNPWRQPTVRDAIAAARRNRDS